MVDWNNIGMPGTRVFDGMRAASTAYAIAQENLKRGNELYEWDQNKDLRDVARDIAYDEAITKRAVEQESNRALRSLGRMRGSLYDGSKEGYMRALDAVNPLAAGNTRRLSKDGKTIETVGVDGQVIGTTPNLSGKMAERAIIQNAGISLLDEVKNFFPRESQEQQMQLQMAMAQDRNRADMLDMQMRMLAGALGMGGGGRGGRGGRGGQGGGNGFSGFETTDFARLRTELATRAAQRAGVTLNERGEPDFTLLPPEEAEAARKRYLDEYKRFEYGYGQLVGQGVDPWFALQGTQNLLDRQDMDIVAREAQAAMAAALASGAAKEADRQARALGRTPLGVSPIVPGPTPAAPPLLLPNYVPEA